MLIVETIARIWPRINPEIQAGRSQRFHLTGRSATNAMPAPPAEWIPWTRVSLSFL